MKTITKRTADSLDNLFRLALLISSDLETAEAAIVWSIETANTDDRSFEALKIAALEKALQASAIDRKDPSTASSAAMLFPPELCGLFMLCALERRSFVLRFLAGLSRATCAELLQAKESELDLWLRSAIDRLAGMETSRCSAESYWMPVRCAAVAAA